MTMTAKTVVLLTALAACLLPGCATNPVTGRQDFVLMSESEEIALGKKYNQQILAEMPAYNDPGLTAYVNEVGQRIAHASHRPDLDYHFTVLDSSMVNAFALPGGYIYITRGIMAYLNSEAELAAVLGHEVGHVTARHSVRQQSAATATGVAGAVLGAATGVP
ncbi:MAG: M48 family metalloprotease, partial [Thiogranum sp.]|nr:M48 family metalloprotease [Thiogranum sp.]